MENIFLRRLQETLLQKEIELSSTVEELREVIRENETLAKQVEDLEKQVKNLQKLNEMFKRRLIRRSKANKHSQVVALWRHK